MFRQLNIWTRNFLIHRQVLFQLSITDGFMVNSSGKPNIVSRIILNLFELTNLCEVSFRNNQNLPFQTAIWRVFLTLHAI